METLRKIDKFIQNIEVDDLVCPICAKKVKIYNKSIVCDDKHTFDINKKGFVKLLRIFKPYDEKIYSRELFDCRRKVINDGFYDFLHDKIVEILNSKHRNNFKILDLGCGEGSHAHKIINCLDVDKCYAVDLSTPAIEMSTDYLNEGLIPIVCDVYNLPFTKCFDAIIDILSPFNYKEIYKVLRDDGMFIKVIPTINYLKEIREVNGLEEYHNEDAVYQNFKLHFNIIYDEIIEKRYKLSSEISKVFLNMTPLTDNIKSKKEISDITISLRVIIGEKK